jgi:hypothetical protein
LGWQAHEEICSELFSEGVFGGLLDCHLVFGGVVFGDLLLAAGLFVRFEVRFLAGAVAVCNGFAVVAGLERLGRGVDGVAVGASVGSHNDAAGNG